MLTQCGDHRVEQADLRARGRGVKRAVEPELGIDSVLGTEVANPPNRSFGRFHQPDCFGLAKQTPQCEEFRRPRQQAATVAAACARAAQIALDDHDVEIGFLLLRLDGGPQTGETTTDDADIGCRRALQCGRQ
jgi:hypothetical protein